MFQRSLFGIFWFTRQLNGRLRDTRDREKIEKRGREEIRETEEGGRVGERVWRNTIFIY